VTATHRGMAKGGLVIDTTNGILYQQFGTPPNSGFVKVSDE
jgi:hypothetical protein